jgi:hypothetical protein
MAGMHTSPFPQTPTFRAQNTNDRQEIIRACLDPKEFSIEEVDGELARFFSNWGGTPCLDCVTYDAHIRRRQPGIRPTVIYKIDEPKFGGDPRTDPQKMGSLQVWGPNITYGLLQDIFEVIHIWKAKSLRWTDEMRASFKNDHLTAVQEVLALGRWMRASNVIGNFKTTTKTGKDVDWRFDIGNTQVLLEVKFRRTDWRRGHPETKTFNTESLFEEIESKFPESGDDSLHVAHVTLIQPTDKDVISAAKEFSKSLRIHAVILESTNGGEITIVGRERNRVERELTNIRRFPRPAVAPIIFKRPSMHRSTQ